MLEILARYGSAPAGAISAVHSGNMGDIVYSLPTVAKLGVRRLVLNACSDPGAGGRSFSRGMAEFLVPLLLAQPGIEQVDIAEVPLRVAAGFGDRARSTFISSGLPLEHVPAHLLGVDHVLDLFRLQPLDRLHIIDAHARALRVGADGLRPYVSVPGAAAGHPEGPILLSLTPRYRHVPTEFFEELLRGMGPVVMVGLPKEAELYRGIDGEFVTVTDGLDLARRIAGARLFLGAPSMPYAIAEGLKLPRLVDIPAYPANAFPLGPDGWLLPESLPAARRLLTELLNGSPETVRTAAGGGRATLAPRPPARCAAMVYLRTGPHFAEPPDSIVPMTLSEVAQDVVIPLPAQPAALTGVRFDPADVAAGFALLDMRIEDEAGNGLWTWKPDAEALQRQAGDALFFRPLPADAMHWLQTTPHGWVELPLETEVLEKLRTGGRLVVRLRSLTQLQLLEALGTAEARSREAKESSRVAEERSRVAEESAAAARTAFAVTMHERDSARVERDGARAELDGARAERDRLNLALRDVYHSTSWKVSAPVRWVRRALRR